MSSKHAAIAAGLALTLAFGSVAAPRLAVADDATPGVASEATDIDKGEFIEQSLAGAMRSVQGVSLVNVSNEMKYFTKYESHGNYNQGFSYGDGYNALGYYQFDRRWSLISFMRQAYNYNPAKYSMLKAAIDSGAEISNGANAMYANGQLTELGRIAQDAFQGAYAADPAEFSALQDSYAYNSYYAVTESWLKSALDIDITGRADCVKGMVWSITNMCGTGGCQDFFRWANLSNSMSDREFVTALSNSIVNNVARKYPKQTQYHAGWQNRYRNELKDCLVYIAEDEAAAAKPSEPDGDTKADDDASTDTGANAGSAPGSNDASSGKDGLGNDASDVTVSDDASEGSTASPDAPGANDSNSNSSVSDDSTDSADKDSDSDSVPGASADAGNASGGTVNSEPKSDGEGAGSNGSEDSNKSSEKDDSVTTDDSSKGEPDTDSKDDKSEGEKLGEAVGEALTSGLSKGEGASSSKIDGKDDDGKIADESQDGAKSGDSTDQAAGDDKRSKNKSTNGSMPRTGDIVIMASLASASLATFGMTAIVSGKNKLRDQNEPSGSDCEK